MTVDGSRDPGVPTTNDSNYSATMAIHGAVLISRTLCRIYARAALNTVQTRFKYASAHADIYNEPPAADGRNRSELFIGSDVQFGRNAYRERGPVDGLHIYFPPEEITLSASNLPGLTAFPSDSRETGIVSRAWRKPFGRSGSKSRWRSRWKSPNGLQREF